MKVTQLNQKISYKLVMTDFNNNLYSVVLESDKILDTSNTTEIREILLDYIVDVMWENVNNTSLKKLRFLNEQGEAGELYVYIDTVVDEPLCKVIDSLIRLKEIEADYISHRELFEILFTLCFKNFK